MKKSRRDSKDVAAVMLKVAAERKAVRKVDMLYGARSSNSDGSALLQRIIDSGLLQYDNSSHKRYHITKDGRKFLNAYGVIMKLLPKV